MDHVTTLNSRFEFEIFLAMRGARWSLSQQTRSYAKVPYNKARRFDWKPLRESVYGKAPAFLSPEQRDVPSVAHR